MKTAVVALGKIGLPLAVQFADAGHEVVGVDVNPRQVELINQATEAGDTDEVNRIKALDDAAVIKEDTGSYVFIRIYGYVLDAMEDFAVVLEVSNGLMAA